MIDKFTVSGNSMDILARDLELGMLEDVLHSQKPEFLAVFGRRRVGKTYLIRNYYATRSTFFHLTGIREARTAQQLWNFNTEFADVFTHGIAPKCPANWQEAFETLRKAVADRKNQGKIVLFFDELPWLDGRRSGFISALSYAWNRYFSNDPGIVLVVCGSAASWMVRNVIDSKGSLYNRVTRQLRLKPLDLRNTELYLHGKAVHLDRRQLVDLYIALGGIPAYLDLVQPGHSSTQVISSVCLSQEPNSLYGEFDRMYRSLFSRSELHLRVVRALAECRSGIDREEFLNQMKEPSGSTLLRVVNELIESGFVSEMQTFRNRKRNALLRLVDEYSLFHLKWHDQVARGQEPVRSDFWQILQNTPAWRSWSGYAFEGVCIKHSATIAKALGIPGILYDVYTWRERGTEKTAGAQIDMIIDRADNCINLCEIKFLNTPLEMTREFADELLHKKQRFQEVTGTKKTLFITLITSAGVIVNSQYNRAVQNHLGIDDLFCG